MRLRKSGESSTVGKDICPYYDEMDKFLGCRPMTQPHYQETSLDDDDDKVYDVAPFPPLDQPVNDEEQDEVVDEESVSTDADTTPTKGKINVPGREKRKKKSHSVASDVASNLEAFMAEDVAFKEKQEEMWKQHVELQKDSLKSREEDRELMRQFMHSQEKTSESMTMIMKDLVGVLKGPQRYSGQQPASYDYPYQYSGHTTHESSSCQQGYAGVGPIHYASESPYDNLQNL